jgi:hypothetical protein
VKRAAVIAVFAVLLAGCGEQVAVNTGDPTPAEEFQYDHPVIAEPANGDTVDASDRFGDQLTANVTVRGSAEPSTKVIVSTECKDDGCRVPTRTDAQGAFEAKVRLSVDTAQPRGTVIVSYDQNVSIDTDRVIVTVNPPNAASDLPTRATRQRGGSSKNKTSRSRSRAPALPTAAPTQTQPESEGPATAAPTQPPTTTSARNLVVIGDSLAVGMQPFLGQYLPGWNVSVDARIGRPLAEGMSRLAAANPSGKTVYAFSLFTNDDPTQTSALESAVRRTAQRGCVVWATVARPPVNGKTYASANAILNRLASPGRIQIVPWAEQASANPSWLAGDGVHGTPTGYRNRAALFAAAAKSCAA